MGRMMKSKIKDLTHENIGKHFKCKVRFNGGKNGFMWSIWERAELVFIHEPKVFIEEDKFRELSGFKGDNHWFHPAMRSFVKTHKGINSRRIFLVPIDKLGRRYSVFHKSEKEIEFAELLND